MRQIPDSGPDVGEYAILWIPIYLKLVCSRCPRPGPGLRPHAFCFPVRVRCASRLQQGLGLLRTTLNDERVNFVTDSAINNIAISLSRCDLLSSFEPWFT